VGKTLTKTVKIDPSALLIIDGMEWVENGTQVVGKLTCGQLDRKMYEQVNKGLDLLGGKWNKKQSGHVFSLDPRLQIDSMLSTGFVTVEKDGFFCTPKTVTLQMLSMFRKRISLILEPSAGDGGIVDVLPKALEVHCIEKNTQRQNILKQKGYTVLECSDFLEFTIRNIYSAIIMNPPFENLQDVDHVTHAYSLLADGGEVVSVMAESVFFRENAKCKVFRDLVTSRGYSVKLPEGSFRESGTMVGCRLVYLEKG
jgi:hypothetical protein